MDSKFEKEFEIRDIKDRDEEIRLKKLENMTKEDALYTILRMINEANYFPCGYSHTYKALEILKGEKNGII